MKLYKDVWHIESNNSAEREIGDCWKINDFALRRQCIFDTTEKYRNQIPFMDLFSIGHFIYGLGMGAGFLAIGFLFPILYPWILILGGILLIPINLFFHFQTKGIALVDNRNSATDLFLSICGFVIVIGIWEYFF